MTAGRQRLVSESGGQDPIDDALLAAGISVVTIPTVPLIGATLSTVDSNLNGQVTRLPGGGS